MADKGTASHTSADKQSASPRQRTPSIREPLAPTQSADGIQRTIADALAAFSGVLDAERPDWVECAHTPDGVEVELHYRPSSDVPEK